MFRRYTLKMQGPMLLPPGLAITIENNYNISEMKNNRFRSFNSEIRDGTDGEELRRHTSYFAELRRGNQHI